ncbi:hypothetical protein NDU88_005846 [Pleurodeles waltl]|uniref:Uncharacterized protein n=1 Tax=Pleurodeles waltl TaxID=8319 RepID=A0AAV7SMT7_PLEWA|nr:hypothetical protein NDU88_005846 [Pleurodeles waltl]
MVGRVGLASSHPEKVLAVPRESLLRRKPSFPRELLDSLLVCTGREGERALQQLRLPCSNYAATCLVSARLVRAGARLEAKQRDEARETRRRRRA